MIAPVSEGFREEISEALVNSSSPAISNGKGGRGIVICGGGYKYFTNAYVVARLLKQHGCDLRMELWCAETRELNRRTRALAEKLGFDVRLPPRDGVTAISAQKLPDAARWQWLLKPYAILHSKFDEVLYIDADSFPTRNPAQLFESTPYREHGAVFWPDVRVTGRENPIWDMMGVPFRYEPEFESGQMVIDKRRCWEPLQLALWMNERADQFYQFLWGDKDTFRFAWHKFGRPFGMIHHPPQPLHFPGSAEIAGLCQHDLDGNWLFQHRNMAKWDLLGVNPRIPGYLFENESRRYLADLRKQWNGQVRVAKQQRQNLARSQRAKADALKRDLRTGVWLFEDRRPKPGGCCAPPIEWSEEPVSIPWASETRPEVVRAQRHSPRYIELSFSDDSIGRGAQKELYWWDIKLGMKTGAWTLELLGEAGTTVSMRLQTNGTWLGEWKRVNGSQALNARLVRPGAAYPEQTCLAVGYGDRVSTNPIHLANHANGIGDAIVGLYAVTGLVRRGVPVIFHTRYPQWLARVAEPNLTITDEPPPTGTRDINSDYDEQTRYGMSRAGWYAMIAAAADPRLRESVSPGVNIAPLFRPARPSLTRILHEPVLDLENYVLIAPFPAWGMRDWTEAHWRRLALLLNESGYEVVACGTKEDEDRLRRTFDKSNAYWVLNQPPEWITAAMLKAQCVIGVDSGMIHLAGLLGVPAICIHSHLPPKFLFNCAPSVFSVTPDTSCTFCRWQEDRGYNEGCATACSALATVSPEQVAAEVASEKLARIRGKIRRLVERDTKRAITTGTSSSRVRVAESRVDVIAYTYPPDCGLGEAAETNIRAMRELGLTVEKRIWSQELILESALADPQQIYYHHWHPQPTETARDWRRAGFGAERGAYHIAYWAYEIEKGLPKEFGVAAPVMREIWTPSSFCQGLFAETGLPVHVVPHTVPYVESLAELPSRSGKAPFTVLSLFDAWSRFARKNPQAVIRVFQKAFPDRFDVRLVIKGHHLSDEQMQNLKAVCRWDPRITVLNRFLSDEELTQLFASADVYLGMQRGEGFGLNLARALGRGLPVITTGWSGNLDFCKPDNSFLLPFQLSPVAVEADAFYREGMWAEPDEEAAATKLARVAEMVAKADPELAAMRERGRKLIAMEFNQQRLCDRIKERFAAIRTQQSTADASH